MSLKKRLYTPNTRYCSLMIFLYLINLSVPRLMFLYLKNDIIITIYNRKIYINFSYQCCNVVLKLHTYVIKFSVRNQRQIFKNIISILRIRSFVTLVILCFVEFCRLLYYLFTGKGLKTDKEIKKIILHDRNTACVL